MVTSRKASLFKFIAILISIFFSLVIGILLVQIFYNPTPVYAGWNSLSGLGGVSPNEVNQLHFRGQKIEYEDDDFVIVMLGDSQVEAQACAYGWMPERRLQHYLNVEHGKNVKVFTLGASGYGQDQQLLALRGYLKDYRADLVVLWQSPVNDVWNNIFPTNWPANGVLKPTYWLENGELQGPNYYLGEPVDKTSRLEIINLFNRLNMNKDLDGDWEKYLPEPYQPLLSSEGPVNETWQNSWNRGGMRDENLATEKSHMAISLIPRSERMQYGLDLTHKLLLEIEKTTVDQGGKFVIFVTEPFPAVLTEPNDYIMVLNGKYYHVSTAQYYENTAYMNRGFEYHILPVTTTEPTVGPDDGHLNEHAVDQVMKDLAFILSTQSDSLME